MGAISQITDSISSALGTSGSGGGLLGGVSSLLSNPIVDVAAAGAADYFSGGALGGFMGTGDGSGIFGGGIPSLFADSSGTSGIANGSSLGYSSAADSNAASNALTSSGASGATGLASLPGSVNTPADAFGVSSATPAATSDATGYVGNGVGDPTGGVAGAGIGGTTASNSAVSAASPWSLGDLAKTFSTPKGAFSLGTDLYSVYAGQQLNAAAQQYASVQDPMAAYRAQYAQQLQQLQANPSSITSLPGYQAGLEATQRSLAATGQATSGAGLAQLAGYGQNFYQNQVNSLAGLATLGSVGGQAGGTALGVQSLANKANTSAGLNLASLFAQ